MASSMPSPMSDLKDMLDESCTCEDCKGGFRITFYDRNGKYVGTVGEMGWNHDLRELQLFGMKYDERLSDD